MTCLKIKIFLCVILSPVRYSLGSSSRPDSGVYTQLRSMGQVFVGEHFYFGQKKLNEHLDGPARVQRMNEIKENRMGNEDIAVVGALQCIQMGRARVAWKQQDQRELERTVESVFGSNLLYEFKSAGRCD